MMLEVIILRKVTLKNKNNSFILIEITTLLKESRINLDNLMDAVNLLHIFPYFNSRTM